MPTYDYRCDGCDHRMEVFQRMSDEHLTDCPECGESSLRRLIGTGAGVIFKGSGFYETDYKRADHSPGGRAAADSGGSESSEGSSSSDSSDSSSSSSSESSSSESSSSSSSGESSSKSESSKKSDD